jgi:Xaa-Pro aminopeptidase
MNEDRARAVLEELDFAGLIALKPVNVYYLTGCWPVLTRMRYDFGALATFPRSPALSPLLIASASLSWDLANRGRDAGDTLIFTSSPAKGHAVDLDASLNARERGWVDIERRRAGQQPEGSAEALARGLRASGMDRGQVAVDDMRVAWLLERVGLTGVECVPAEDVFRRIRMVKTEAELALQRVAAHNNAEAALAAIRQIEAGMRFEDIEQLFRLECARRGSEMISLLAGMSMGGFPDGEVVRGKPFLIDAVSSYAQYFGDFGRTVVVGDPTSKLLARAHANRIGRDAVFEMIRPGVRFSDLVRVGREAQIQAGMPPEVLIVNPHSVGLEHGDNPGRPDVPFNKPVDIVLEPEMVITVDLPYLEVGWGAGHNEDLIQITRTGFVPMHELSDPLVVV